jgi:hypothetical protein
VAGLAESALRSAHNCAENASGGHAKAEALRSISNNENSSKRCEGRAERSGLGLQPFLRFRLANASKIKITPEAAAYEINSSSRTSYISAKFCRAVLQGRCA